MPQAQLHHWVRLSEASFLQGKAPDVIKLTSAGCICRLPARVSLGHSMSVVPGDRPMFELFIQFYNLGTLLVPMGVSFFSLFLFFIEIILIYRKVVKIVHRGPVHTLLSFP